MNSIPTSHVWFLFIRNHRLSNRAKPVILWGLAVFLLLSGVTTAQVLDTSFTYQGRLEEGGAPADGFFDLDFTPWLHWKILASSVDPSVLGVG